MIALTQVETATATASRDSIRARMNAQLAVMIGLGDLQKYAGADQRATATADILVQPDVDPTAIHGEGSNKWTGVWSSNDTYYDPDDPTDEDNQDRIRVTERAPRHYRPDPTAPIFRFDTELGLVPLAGRAPNAKWLVSGDNPQPTDRLTDANSVALVSVDPDLIRRRPELNQGVVRAPLSQISSSDGQYAYWVGDEGLKARINRVSPYVGAGDDRARANYEASLAQVADPSVLVNDLRMEQPLFIQDRTNVSKWKREDTSFDKFFGRQSLPLMTKFGWMWRRPS